MNPALQPSYLEQLSGRIPWEAFQWLLTRLQLLCLGKTPRSLTSSNYDGDALKLAVTAAVSSARASDFYSTRYIYTRFSM